MIKIETRGLDEAVRKLEDLGRRAAQLEGTHEVPMREIFSNGFMSKYTDFSSFDELLDASGFKVATKEDFAAIPDDQWDAFIAARTRFSSWKEMKEKGGRDYSSRKLGL
jgi:hypothetical protein